MPIEYVKAALVALWIVVVGFVGYAGEIVSIEGWTLLGTVALAAPLVMMRVWRVPAQSMSESIQAVLREPDGGFRGARHQPGRRF